ncbi:hypothetical protein PAHAL_6G225000 [Panicum hallii]|uniref:Uncharacterized protein n=1 Tax=Panicum hallii TaxID=206008 RepID=A0A2T8IH64_9POAL|nr:hypothetical protein PAHAL_6G225000 [Panicum hallii]
MPPTLCMGTVPSGSRGGCSDSSRAPGIRAASDELRNYSHEQLRPCQLLPPQVRILRGRTDDGGIFGVVSFLKASFSADKLSVQTASVESAGTNSSLGQAGCGGSPSQENTSQMVPSHVFQNGASLFFRKTHVFHIKERARKTARGSADDIGWLQRDQNLPATEHGTARFLENLDSARSAEAPNWTSMLMICKSDFSKKMLHKLYMSCGPSHSSGKKKSISYLIQLFTLLPYSTLACFF